MKVNTRKLSYAEREIPLRKIILIAEREARTIYVNLYSKGKEEIYLNLVR